MRNTLIRWALVASVACTPQALALAEYGIEGVGRVSTRADEAGASISTDGSLIVFASNRDGGAGGWDLWQSSKQDGRWALPQPLPFNAAGDERDPFLSADGRWLYFAASGGRGRGLDLYRVRRGEDGHWGRPEALAELNSAGNEHSPALDAAGNLVFASDRRGGSGGLDLWLAAAAGDGDGFLAPAPLPGSLNSRGDEHGAVLLGSRGDLVYARGPAGGPVQLRVAHCREGGYHDGGALALSFNRDDATTLAPGLDHNAPAELLISGSAPSPRAGGLDIYRTLAPPLRGDGSCGRAVTAP